MAEARSTRDSPALVDGVSDEQTPPGRAHEGSPPPAESAEQERSALLRRIRKRMGSRLAALHEPEDVLQDTLLLALQHRPGLELEQAARAWLGSLADTRILTLVAQSRPRARPQRGTSLPAAQVALDLDALLQVPALAESSTVPEDRDFAAHRLRALARLSFEQRATLVLRNFCGLSYKTIGAVLGRSSEAARSLHTRAHRSLLEVLRKSSGASGP